MAEEKVEVDPVATVEALEQRTSGTRYLQHGPALLLFRKGYSLCLELLHHLGESRPRDDFDRTMRDLGCDTLDSLWAARELLLKGYDNQCLFLLRRTVETTSLMAFFINFPSELHKWANGTKVSPSMVRKGLKNASIPEPEDELQSMYRVYSLFSHINRDTVFQRLLGEPNHFTVGAQGNAPEKSVAAIVRELLLQMMWFVDVFNFVNLDVTKAIGPDYGERMVGYRGEVEKITKNLPALF
jgi:hypothetical protein